MLEGVRRPKLLGSHPASQGDPGCTTCEVGTSWRSRMFLVPSFCMNRCRARRNRTCKKEIILCSNEDVTVSQATRLVAKAIQAADVLVWEAFDLMYTYIYGSILGGNRDDSTKARETNGRHIAGGLDGYNTCR